MRSPIKTFLILCAAGLALPGCGDYQAPPPRSDDYSFTPNADNKSTAGAPDPATNPTASDGTNPLVGNGDPLTDQADPLAGDAKAGTNDQAASSSDPLSESGKTQGWYWINGSIPAGAVSIAVNGIPIGRFSVHIDKEITPFCHPGVNTLTFTRDASSPSQAHLKILNGHAAKGSPPVGFYDLDPQPITYDSSPSAPGISGPAAPSLQNDTTPTSASSAPITDTQTFTAQ